MSKIIFWLVIGVLAAGSASFLVMNDFVLLTQTENGLVLGKPAYEKRSAAVSYSDLKVIQETQSLLKTRENWSRARSRTCSGKSPFSLFCALMAASIKVSGKYVHRRPALQEVRFAIDDQFRQRWKVHRLADFNAHPDTDHHNVMAVLATAALRIKSKLGINAK